MKVSLYLLLAAFVIGFITSLFQNEIWSKYVLIPCGLYIAYSFIILTISAINSFRRK
jgi:hypothetical protein